jgi:hypothetical protein
MEDNIDKKPMESDRYELARLRYKYRELILKKKIKLPIQKATKLIGPDCAFHLYSEFSGKEVKKADESPI